MIYFTAASRDLLLPDQENKSLERESSADKGCWKVINSFDSRDVGKIKVHNVIDVPCKPRQCEWKS
ncbi:hypothetical protein CGJ18_22035, partial [Vibrio parahaemolyticus]